MQSTIHSCCVLKRASKKQKLSQENNKDSSGCSRSTNETLLNQGGILQCCICSAEDTNDNNLFASISHVTTPTEKCKVMAITVGNEFLL